MPSPKIPFSISAPDITNPDYPLSQIDITPSNKSIRSTRSTGSPIASWPKTLEKLITTTKTKNSNLTEEALQEFNRRNALETRNSSNSPYYKGLTDFSLVISREKQSGSSPGRESQAISLISSGSKTSFAVKVQEWGSSCFATKKHEKSVSSRNTESGKTITKIKTMKKETELERRKVTFFSKKSDDTIISLSDEKPLRGRDSEPSFIVTAPTPLIPSPPESPPQTPPPSHVQDLPPQGTAAGIIDENKEINTTENEIKYIWADKYRPFWLQDFLCNKKTALLLKNMVMNGDGKHGKCDHFIFGGNPGVGKRTMIWAMLREAFGPDGIKARKVRKRFYLKGEAVSSILVNLMVSQHHIEVNLSELKGYEKHVIVELIKENNENMSNTISNGIQNCNVIVLREADRLSIDGLSYIKWMLEKFKGNNKIFFCCSDSTKLQVIKPLGTHIELLEPSVEEILDVLAFIAEKEGIQLPYKLANKIANNAKNNLRQAIRSFEATWHFNGCNASLEEDQDIKTGWEDKIAKIARNAIEEQSPEQLYNVRGELQNLIEHNVDPDFIFNTLKDELRHNLPEQLKPQFENLYDEYQKNHAIRMFLVSTHNQKQLGKEKNDQKRNVQHFMRIEEFIARFMSWYKGSVTKNKEVEEMQSNNAI